MTRATDKRRLTLIKKYGSEEAYKAKLQEWQAKSRQTYKGGGGFRYLQQNDPNKLKEISRNAAAKKHSQSQDTTNSQDDPKS